LVELDERHLPRDAQEPQVNSALLVVDPSGRIAAANPIAERILEGRAGEIVGRVVWDWFPSTPRDEVPIASTLRQGTRLRGVETVLTRSDRSRVPIGISCSPLLDRQGRKLGAVAIFQDLTEIKQLQRQVLQTEKMASIGQLAAGVAHEINNPMGFIHANLFQMDEYLGDLWRLWRAAAELQQVIAEGNLDEIRKASERLTVLSRELDAFALLEDFGKAIRESQEGSERIRHIVQDLRAFSHEDRNERVLSDINSCLDSTANIAAATMKHSVKLSRQYGELPPVLCNPMQLKQVFLNLLVNAYQAILERVERESDRGEIVLSTEPVGDGVRISIRDTGVGIPPEHQQRIFDPFFTTKEVGVGTGLGLSTSFNIVQRHGGTMHVESAPGRGATFEVWLPADLGATGDA
jgi:PAS domain S-box-containing protein